jgi:Ca2+-binding RTX toxin-like protein
MARINGNNFPNLLRGTSAADIIKGYGSVDALYGLGGNDNMYGGPGNDYLNGGKGSDHLWGGGGHDFFEFKKGDGHFDPGTGKGDIVMDYQDGIDRFYVPGSGIGPGGVGFAAIDTPIGHGTFVTYNGGSFFILGFDGGFAPDDFK